MAVRHTKSGFSSTQPQSSRHYSSATPQVRLPSGNAHPIQARRRPYQSEIAQWRIWRAVERGRMRPTPNTPGFCALSLFPRIYHGVVGQMGPFPKVGRLFNPLFDEYRLPGHTTLHMKNVGNVYHLSWRRTETTRPVKIWRLARDAKAYANAIVAGDPSDYESWQHYNDQRERWVEEFDLDAEFGVDNDADLPVSNEDMLVGEEPSDLVSLEVGGEGDCWKKLWPTPLESDQGPKRSLRLVHDQWRNGYIEEIPMQQMLGHGMAPEWADKTYEEIADHELKHESLVRWSWTESGDLHVEDAWTNEFPCWTDVPVETMMMFTECYIPRPDWPDAISFYDFFRLRRADKTPMVGSAVDIVAEALRVNGTEIGKIAAVELFNNDMNSVKKTRFRCSPAELARLSKYLETPIMSQQQVDSTNDHKFLQVARDLVREDLDAMFPHNTDTFSALHIGSTFQEVKRWYSHAGHDFLFNLKEDKDSDRWFEDAQKFASSRLAKAVIPSLTSVFGSNVRVKFDSVADLLKIFELDGRKRFWFTNQMSQMRKHDILFFEDVLYSMTPEQFGQYWVSQGAKAAYAVLFMPNEFFDPAASRSQLYATEYYYESVENVRALVDEIWPSVLLISPLLPVEQMNEALHTVLTHAFKRGRKTFFDWLHAVAESDFPLELITEAGVDLIKIGPIVRQVLKHVKRLLKTKAERVRLAWRGGFSNAYDEWTHRWTYWIRERRMRIAGTDQYVDWEIKSKRGEMYLLKFYPSTAASPISYSLTLSENQATVLVADLVTAWDPKRREIVAPSYFPTLQADFMKIVNWGLGEPVESLNIAVMITMLNRARGGLSLASNVIVEPMNITDREVVKVAMGALMEIYRLQGILADIESNPELLETYQTNAAWIAEKIAVSAAVIFSGGTAVPLYFLYKWLCSARQTFEFVKYPTEPKIITIPAKPNSVPRHIESGSVEVVLPPPKKKPSKPCVICELQTLGKFSRDGIPENGQQFHISKHKEDNVHDIGFEGREMILLQGIIRDAKNAHMQMNATKLTPLIAKMEHFFEANTSGIAYSVRISSIRGGPGTGKTEVIKALAAYYEDNGSPVAIGMPFKELTYDYEEAEVLGSNKRRTFNANTIWYLAKLANMSKLIIDEATGVDWNVIRAMAIFLGVNELILVGDNDQTGLSEARNEGVQPWNPGSGLDWTRVPDHDLVWNYRLGAWRTKLLNHIYGYRMRSKRSDQDVPLVMTRDTYQAMVEKDPVSVEMVFAHAAAPIVFGKESAVHDDDKNNMSVRSKQGKTYETAAVSCSEIDRGVIGTHGMLNVAISRSKKVVYLVAPESTQDPICLEVQNKLWIDTPERIQIISNLPWPELPAPDDNFKMDESDARIETFMRGRVLAGKVACESSCDQPDRVVTQIDLPKQTIDLNDHFVPVVDPYALEPFFDQEFNLCLFDALKPFFEPDKIREFKCWFLESIYWCDISMGRLKGQSVLTAIFDGFDALPVVDGKRMLPVKPFFWEVNKRLGPVAALNSREPGTIPFVASTQNGVKVDPVGTVLVEKNHAEPFTPKPVRVTWRNMPNRIVEAEPLQVVDGHYIIEYKRNETGVYNIRTGKHIGLDFGVEVIPDEDFDNALELMRDAVTQQRVADLNELLQTGPNTTPPAREIEIIDDSDDDLLDADVSVVSDDDIIEVAGYDFRDGLADERRYCIAIPSYEGKTTLAKGSLLDRYPNLFKDQDEVTMSADEKTLRKLKKLFLEQNWFEHNRLVAKIAEGCPGRVLLTHNRQTAPKDREFLGSFLLTSPTFGRYNLDNRAAIRQEGDYTIHSGFRARDEAIFAKLRKTDLGHLMEEKFDPRATLRRVSVPKVSRDDYHRLTHLKPFASSWCTRPNHIKAPTIHRKTPFRCGTDGYKLAPLIDPSGAWTRSSALNEYATVAGPKCDNGFKINWSGFWFDRTKAGKLKPRTQRSYRSINPGMANHFNNTPEETLVAADRLGKKGPKPKLNAENKAFAEEMAKHAYRTMWKPAYNLMPEEENRILQGAIRDAISRNYHERARAERMKSFGKIRLVLSNKDQEKPIKNDKLNLFKGGQALLQTPANHNLSHIGHMRVSGNRIKAQAQPHFFLDDYEDSASFRTRFTRAVQKLPVSASIAICDFEEFDSQQNEVTLHAEKTLVKLLGQHDNQIAEYYACRGNLDMVMYGLFAGKTNYERGSGFPDTKSGNGIVSTMSAVQVLKGVGPKVQGGKGDDVVVVQSGLKIDETKLQHLKTYTGMNMLCDVKPDGGEFIGNVVSRAGMFPSITRSAMKAICKRANNYQMFTEHQKSYRDTVKEWLDCGIQETIAYSALAEKKTIGYVEACLTFYNSMGHINKTQWEHCTRSRKNNRYFLPNANGPTLF